MLNKVTCSNVETRRFCDMEPGDFGVVTHGPRIGEVIFKISCHVIFLGDGEVVTRFQEEYRQGECELQSEAIIKR